MNQSRRGALAALAAPLSALIVVLSVAVPLLERADIRHESAVESQHDPSTCPTAHDHTVCTQVGANHVAPSGGVGRRPQPTSFASRAPASAAPRGSAPPTLGPPSRAPPVATA